MPRASLPPPCAWTLLAMLGVVLVCGCEEPRVVDCETGTFTRVGEEAWCVFGPRDGTRCPRLLPEEHRLPWGGRGCAERDFETLPDHPCLISGECERDAGAGS